MSRARDGVLAISNGGAGSSSAAFSLNGGRYLLECAATGSGGTVLLQKLGPDGTTYNTIPPMTTALTAAGAAVYDLTLGTYKVVTTTLTAVYVSIERVPGE